MKIFTSDQSVTKICPFCSEAIQAKAIKCRFCAEFLNTDEAEALKPKPDENRENILFSGRPSLCGLAGAIIRGVFLIGVAVFLIVFPIENFFMAQPQSTETYGLDESSASYMAVSQLTVEVAAALGFGLSEQQAVVFAKYRKIAGAGLGIIVLLVLLAKMIKLKMTYYEITTERIEWSRGVFDRRIDNIDMFRVVDIRLRRSLLDCVFGIGTVNLITDDKTDPEFDFQKVRQPRRLYDIIKRASLEADQRNSVVHLE